MPRLLFVYLLNLFIGIAVGNIEFSEVPSDVVVAIGSQAQFSCIFTSPNSASISWSKDGTTLIPSERIQISNTGLTIAQTQEGDEGTYSCIVTDLVDSETDTRSADLNFAEIHDSFVINPESKTLMEGGSTTLFCVHSGSLPSATIAWTRDGVTLSNSNSRFTITSGILNHVDPPQTSSSLSIDPVVLSDSGDYACMATNSLLPDEAIHSSNAVIAVLAQLKAPTITLHPSPIILDSYGQTVVMECSSSGEPVPSVVWTLNDQELDTSPSKISVVTNGGNSTLSITNVQSSDVGSYHCTATNTQGSVDSNDASLKVAFFDESFLLSPDDTIVLVSLTVLLHCSPPNSYPAPSLTWFKGGVALTGDRFSVQGNGSLMIAGSEFIDEGSYTCVATNEYLNITRTSSPALLQIFEIPVITSSDDLVINENSSFSLTCNYTGVPSPTVTWYKDDVQLSSNNPDKINILTNQIIVYSVTEGDEGVYQCRVVNQVGSSEADIAVDVIPIPVHLISSVSLTSIIHSPVTLPCHVEPDQSILYTWTKDNQPLSLPSPGYQLLVNGSLYIQSTAVNQQGGYVCTAANSAGSSQGTVTLTVQVPASVMAVTDSLTASQGQNIELTCTVAGDPPPTVTWYHGNRIVPNEDSVNIALKDDNTSLTFEPVLASHEGSYVCAVDNGVGQDNDTIVLTVTVAPSISVSPVSQTLIKGDTALFTCVAPGDPAPTVTWLTTNSVNVLLLGDSRIEVSENNTLSISNITLDDAASFICRAVNVAGTASAIVTLHVQVSPSISLPSSINATQGATITLDCDATGVPTPSIVWYKDGSLLQENDRLSISHDLVTIDNAFTTDSGTYSCVAVNVVDSVTADVVLDVRILPLIIIPNPMLSVNEGDDAHFQCIVSGTPQPTLTWFYGSIPLPNPTLPRFSLGTNNTLILSEVSHDTDEGLVVVCQATNIAGTESAILTVDVNLHPSIVALNTSLISVVEGSPLRLGCSATGEPFPVITWYNNEIAITTNTPGFQYINNGLGLVVASVLKSQEGNFTCVSTNVAGTDSAVIPVFIQVPPSFSPIPTDSLAIENSAHSMTCTTLGDPLPLVQWTKGGVTLSNDSTLQFPSVSRSDTGSYTCTASNVAGIVDATVYLDVYYLPDILVPPTDIQVPVSGSASFTCTVAGNPTPTVQWLFNGLSIPGAESQLYTVSSVTADDVGTYTCQVTNIVGTVTNSASLDIILPPGSPNVTLVDPVSSSSLSVLWTPPLNNGGSPVTSYIIEYRPMGSTFPYQTASVTGDALTSVITGLQAYTHYHVRMRAGNVAGNSDPSDLYQPSIRTHPSSPEAPANLTFFAVEMPVSGLDLTWAEPSTLNGELGVYQLLVTRGGVAVIDEILFVDQFTVTGLSDSVTYTIQVRASSRGILDNALWGPYTTLHVLNGVAVDNPSPSQSFSLSPSSTVCLVTTPSCVATVTVTASKTESSSITSIISMSSFKTTPTATPSKDDSNTISEFSTKTSASVTMTTETSVTMTTDNAVTITTGSASITIAPSSTLTTPISTVSTTTSTDARNGGGGGDTSSIAVMTSSSSSSVMMLPTITPSPPTIGIEELTLSVPVPNTIEVVWIPPTEQLDTIDGYNLYINPPPDDVVLPIVLGKEQSSFTIMELQGLVTYSVAIATFNLGGEGPVMFDMIETLGSSPGPPTNIQSTVDFGLGQVTVQWGPPESYDGILVSYHLLFTETNTFVDTPSSLALMPGQEEATQSMMFFLQGSNYILVIAAETTVGLGTPSDGHVINLIEVPPSSSTTPISSSTTPPSSSTTPPTSSTTPPSSSSIPLPSSSVSSSNPSVSCPASLVAATTCDCPTTTVFVASSPSSCLSPISTTSSSSSITIVPSPPSVVVSGVSLFTPNKGEVVASWQLPSSDVYDGFHIYISPSAGFTLPITVSVATTFYQFSGLDNGVIYTVTIATYNGGGDGPSVSETVQTIGELPGTPFNIQTIVDPVTAHVLVMWSAPNVLGGTLISYHVEATHTETQSKFSADVSVPFDFQTNDYNTVLDSLIAGDYSITVRAENNVGLGPVSDPPVLVSVPNIAVPSTTTTASTVGTTTSTASSINIFTTSQQITTTVTTTITVPPTSTNSSLVSSDFVTSSISSYPSTSLSLSTSVMAPSMTINETSVGTNSDSSIVVIVTPIVVVLVVLFVLIVVIIVLVQYRLYSRGSKKGIFKVSEIDYELTPAPVSNNNRPSNEVTSNEVTPTKKPRYYSQEELDTHNTHSHSDRENLIRAEVPVSQRDAYEEPLSDEGDSDGFVETEPVNPIPQRGGLEKGKVAAGYDPTYEDVNVIRARKAKEREEKLRKQQQQTTSVLRNSKKLKNKRQNSQVEDQRKSIHDMY